MNSKYVLLVIDMQLCAFDGKITPAIVGGELLLQQVQSALEIARANNISIVYLQTRAALGQPYAEDMHGWKIHPDVSPRNSDTTVYKKNSSGFDGTNLKDALAGLGTKSVIVCGIWSQYCVANTCLDALKLGLEVTLVSNAHGTWAEREEEAKSIVRDKNKFLKEKGVSLLKTSEIPSLLAEAI